MSKVVRVQTVWQLDVVEQLAVLLYDHSLTYKRIAELLSERIGKRISKGSVIGFCQRHGIFNRGPVDKPRQGPRRRKAPHPAAPKPKRIIYDQVSLVDLGRGCRWPIGLSPPYQYCGRPRHQASYCKEHAQRAFQLARRR